MNLRPLKPTPTNQTIALVTAFYLFYSYAFYLFNIYKLKLISYSINSDKTSPQPDPISYTYNKSLFPSHLPPLKIPSSLVPRET